MRVASCALCAQFERTLIVAEDDSQVSYLEGCTAPSYDSNQVPFPFPNALSMQRLRVLGHALLATLRVGRRLDCDQPASAV